MFQEELAEMTADHLRGHIEAYLTEIQARYADRSKLQLPKTIETANLVGGVYNTTVNAMPAYAVDVIDKAFSEMRDNLWLYQYSGHIAGVVSGNDERAVNRLVKRHEAAVELFVRTHLNFHYPQTVPNSADFSLIELQFIGAAFSGAEQIDMEQDRKIWIAGFRNDLAWIASEEGPGNHG